MSRPSKEQHSPAVKELVDDFLYDFTQYRDIAKDDTLTMSLVKSDEEYRCVKCGQLLGSEQTKCPCCKRDVKIYVTPDQDTMYKSLVDEDVKPEDILVHVAILKKPKVSKIFVATGIFFIAYSIIHLIAQFI